MITKDLIDKIKVNFSLTNYWLEKFLHVNHAMFFRYANGISEARFSEVMKWLNKLNLCVINEKIYFKTNLHESIDVFPKWFKITKLNSILDDQDWSKYGAKEEKENGHTIFWPK